MRGVAAWALVALIISLPGCSEQRRGGAGGGGGSWGEGDDEGAGEGEGEGQGEGEGEGQGEGEGEGQGEGEGEGEGHAECADHDGDGYGVGPGCLGPDCNDFDRDVNPGVEEDCTTGTDDNCNDETNEGCGRLPDCTDGDRDGFGEGTGCLGPDCDDTNAGSYPGARERCDDGLDNNCDGSTDEGCGPGGHGTGCDEMYSCIFACEDRSCENECQARGSNRARELYQLMTDCFIEYCYNAYDFPSCAEAECGSEIDACFSDM